MTPAKTARANRTWELAGGQARVFSGHESFACRYGWLPKLYEAVEQDEELFADDERAILALGLGKNMVRSIRFWGARIRAAGRATRSRKEYGAGAATAGHGRGVGPVPRGCGVPLEVALVCDRARRSGRVGNGLPRVAGRAGLARSVDRRRAESGRGSQGIGDAENGDEPRGHPVADVRLGTQRRGGNRARTRRGARSRNCT